VPITAHILGGARMAESAVQGVVDGACRVFGHPGLWVVDGAAIPVNLGANPSLTIAALAEHAMAQIPPKGSSQRGEATWCRGTAPELLPPVVH
jgi:cholesterol oxidase